MIIRASSQTRLTDPHAMLAILFLRANPDASIAYVDPHDGEPTIIAHTQSRAPRAHAHTFRDGTTFNIKWVDDSQPKIQIAEPLQLQSQSPYQACQNAPIKLGCQIQPYRKNWVGTAGGPIKFVDAVGQTHWGFITNAHVSGPPANKTEAQIHQPSDSRPPIGTTITYAYPAPHLTNTLDVALIDSKVDGHHKTDWAILPDVTPSTQWSNASPKAKVQKSGRSTGLTEAECCATGVAARINYGHAIYTFADLDLFEAPTPFSQPGDSGSLILLKESLMPVSLLFAGSTRSTLGIPIRNIARQFKISFKP